MNSRLEPAIRLARWRVDEEQRALAELMRAIDRLAEDEAALAARIESEKHAVGADHLAALQFGAFVQAALDRLRRIASSRAELQARVPQAQEALRQAFLEQKTVELAQAERTRREMQRRRAKENAMLDEIGLDGFRRKQRA